MKKLFQIFIALALFTSIISSVHVFADSAVNIQPEHTVGVVSTVYHLLAPIGIKGDCIDTSGLDQTCAKGGIGDYFNIFFNLAIGICGVLAVVYIVIGGIQWMGDESVFGKTEAKSRITQAVLGLLIALGSYALLNTIDPHLLGTNGLTINQVEIKLEAPMEYNDPVPPTGTVVGQCPEGIISVSTTGGNFPTCAPMAGNIKSMINDAWAKGYKISGYGFRSKASQIALRTQNCGGSQYVNDPNAKCNPDTAMPGTSMHESGKAFDLKCDGLTIRATDNKCFVWLKTYASSYGLYNLPTEPWHWSTTGH